MNEQWATDAAREAERGEKRDEDQLIDAALAVLAQTPRPPSPPSLPLPSPSPALASPTLAALDASRRPTAGTVCEDCPNSVWFASPAELKCYCRVMFLVTWSSRAPNAITHCDGAFLGTEDPGREDCSPQA